MVEGDPARDNLALLARCLVFEALGEDAQRTLAARAYRSSYSAGDPIFHIGDPGESMMVMIVGSVRIALPTRQGREIILADLEPGELFGEIALLDGEPRTASAVALTNCQLLVLERRHVVPFLAEHPEASQALIRLLCARVRRADERMTDIAMNHLPTRLAKTLVARAGSGSQPRGAKKLSVSQRELADMVGATRESVNRQLRTWHDSGIVELREGWIVLLRGDALSALAGCA